MEEEIRLSLPVGDGRAKRRIPRQPVTSACRVITGILSHTIIHRRESRGERIASPRQYMSDRRVDRTTSDVQPRGRVYL